MNARIWIGFACLAVAFSLLSLPAHAHPGHRFDFIDHGGHGHDDDGSSGESTENDDDDHHNDGDDNDPAAPPVNLRIEPAATISSPVPEPAARLVVYYRSGAAGQHGDRRAIALEQPVSVATANAMAAELKHDPNVSAVLVDRRIGRHSISTNDTLAYLMWNLGVGAAGSTNVEPMWPQGSGTGVTVAVLDTGSVVHPDMNGAWTGGYDFVSDAALAGDGNGRDADPTDTMTCDNGSGPQTGSPHGLQVASVIAARANNNAGIAGVAPLASVQPIRVIADCGGWLSDVLDGMRWAVGLPVAGVPTNPNPVKVLNLSLGTTSPGALCTPTVQAIVDEVRATGATIVVSTGNDSASAITVPAACQGVIAVTANSKFGNRASYANVGAGTTISAAGGGCQNPSNTSCVNSQYNYITVATHDTATPDFVISAGTSFAAPHVSAAVALMLERNPTRTPDEITSALVNASRAFGTGACPSGQCGAGTLDIQATLQSSAFSVSAQAAPASARGGESVVLTVAVDASANSPIYRWRQTSGPAVVLAGADTATASFTAPQFDGSISFEVTATDTSGLAQIANVSLPVTVAPELAPIGQLQVDPQSVIRQAVVLLDGSVPQAISVDATAAGFGVTVEGNEIVWTVPDTGFFTFQVTPHDAIGAGIGTNLSILVNGTDTSTTGNNPMTGGGDGGGGALGIHGAILLVLAWLARRRVFGSSAESTALPLTVAFICLSLSLFGFGASQGAATATVDANLWLASFAHIDPTHLLVNLAGLLLLSVALAGQIKKQAWFFSLMVAAPVAHWMVTAVGYYPWALGLSTALHAVAAFTAVSLLMTQRVDTNHAQRRFAVLLSLGILVKLWLDTIWITSFDGATSAPSLHAYAVLVAAVGAAAGPAISSVVSLSQNRGLLRQSVND